MWNRLLRKGNPNDQRPMTNAPLRRPRGQWSVVSGSWLSLVIGHLLVPALAWAHGDDDVTALSVLGPLILVAVLAAGLGIGRPLVRWLARRE